MSSPIQNLFSSQNLRFGYQNFVPLPDHGSFLHVKPSNNDTFQFVDYYKPGTSGPNMGATIPQGSVQPGLYVPTDSEAHHISNKQIGFPWMQMSFQERADHPFSKVVLEALRTSPQQANS